jgi:hypothetical protein
MKYRVRIVVARGETDHVSVTPDLLLSLVLACIAATAGVEHASAETVA